MVAHQINQTRNITELPVNTVPNKKNLTHSPTNKCNAIVIDILKYKKTFKLEDFFFLSLKIVQIMIYKINGIKLLPTPLIYLDPFHYIPSALSPYHCINLLYQ